MDVRISRIEDAIVEIRGSMSAMHSDLSAVRARLDVSPTTATIVWAAFSASAAVIAIIIAVLAFAGDRFDGGIGLSDLRLDQLQRDAEQDQKLDGILNRLGALLAAPATPDSQAPLSPSE